MNRRDLLPAAAASLMLPAGAVKAEGISITGISSHPDAALLAACAEYLRIQRDFEAYYDTLSGDMDRDDACGSAMLEPLPGLVDQIVSLHATTADGFTARARCGAFHWLPQARVCQDDPEGAPEDRMKAAGMRDFVAMERGAVISCPVVTQAPGRHPDADLLEACAAYQAMEASRPIAIGQAEECGTPECDEHEAAQEAITERADVMVGDLADTPAVRREGMQA